MVFAGLRSGTNFKYFENGDIVNFALVLYFLLSKLIKRSKKMDIVTLLSNLKASLDALSAQLVDAQAAAKSAYDKGFADGVASVPPSGPSQADLDAANAKIADLQSQLAVLAQQVADAQAAVAAAVQKVKDGAKAVVDALELKEQADGVDAKAQIDAL